MLPVKSRTAAKEFGRDPYDIKLFAGATVIVAPTRAEAEDLLEDYARHVDQEGQLALAVGLDRHRLLDLSARQADRNMSKATRSSRWSRILRCEAIAGQDRRSRDPEPRRRSLALRGRLAQDVADELIAWAEETDVDGFNLFRLVVPESLNAFVDLVVPELQSRGVYKTAYRDGTLREKLFPGRGARLPAVHPAAGFRHLAAPPANPVRSDAAE